METFQAVKMMLAVRSYRDRPISDEDVTRILEAGRLPASSQNRQHWDFIAVRDRERLQQLGQMARSGSYIAEAARAIGDDVQKDRKPLSEVAHAEAYGQPYEG